MNYAKDIIIPKTEKVFRVIFLYVGQGDSTLLVIPSGDEWKYMLIDTNVDVTNGGIDVVKLLNDLLDDGLDIFTNTHPHKDHLEGVKKIHDSVTIKEIWHSGHKPGKDHLEAYKELESIMKDIRDEHVLLLKGSNEENKLGDNDYSLGDVGFNVLSPAEYVSDEIEDEKPEERYNRIHEQCGVIRFSYGTERKCILITGDADKTAWQKHITEYHKERIPSDVLSAAHHGSRSFFKSSEDDEEPFKEHVETIQPSYIIISAPKQSESPHGHPHDDAKEIYKEYVDDDALFHLGKNRECVIVDIHDDGNIEVKTDKELVEHYGFNSDKGYSKSLGIGVGIATERIDNKTMGYYEMV